MTNKLTQKMTLSSNKPKEKNSQCATIVYENHANPVFGDEFINEKGRKIGKFLKNS